LPRLLRAQCVRAQIDTPHECALLLLSMRALPAAAPLRYTRRCPPTPTPVMLIHAAPDARRCYSMHMLLPFFSVEGITGPFAATTESHDTEEMIPPANTRTKYTANILPPRSTRANIIVTSSRELVPSAGTPPIFTKHYTSDGIQRILLVIERPTEGRRRNRETTCSSVGSSGYREGKAQVVAVVLKYLHATTASES